MMDQVTVLPIKQLDGSIEDFFVIDAKELIGVSGSDDLQYDWSEYRVYKRHPMAAFSIRFQQKENGIYLKKIHDNFLPEYQRKNIVFEMLMFISDKYKCSIFSSLREDFLTEDATDRLVPETMGKRWAKLQSLHPERVRFLEEQGRYVFLASQE